MKKFTLFCKNLLHICEYMHIFVDMGRDTIQQRLSPKELAAYAGVHPNTVYKWINNGLKICRNGNGGRIMILKEDYESWIGL